MNYINSDFIIIFSGIAYIIGVFAGIFLGYILCKKKFASYVEDGE